MFKSNPKTVSIITLTATLVLTSLVYLPFIFGFFVQDDFFLLSVSRVKHFQDAINLFIPLKEVVWYRPLSSQIFFMLGRFFFGLNPLYFHIIVFTTHLLNVILLRNLVLRITYNRNTAALGSFIYAVSSIHFIALYWLATYSFTLGVTFVLTTSLLFLKKKYLPALLTFILGLLASEVTLLLILPLVLLKNSNQRLKAHDLLHFLPFIFFALLIVFLRNYIFPNQIGGDYTPHISYTTLFLIKFYASRTLGLPMLMEIMTPPLKAVVIILAVTLISLILKELSSKMTNLTESKKELFIFLLLSVSFIAPFLTLSNHYSPHYLTFSLLGTSGFLGLIFSRSTKLVKVTFLASFLLLQIITIWWTHETHWIVKRASLAGKLVKEKRFSHAIGSEEYFSLGADYAGEVYNF